MGDCCYVAMEDFPLTWQDKWKEIVPWICHLTFFFLTAVFKSILNTFKSLTLNAKRFPEQILKNPVGSSSHFYVSNQPWGWRNNKLEDKPQSRLFAKEFTRRYVMPLVVSVRVRGLEKVWSICKSHGSWQKKWVFSVSENWVISTYP